MTNKPESTPSLHPSEAPTESNRSTYASPDPDSAFYASIARLPDVFQSIEAKPPGKKRRKSNKPSKQTTTDDYPPDHVEHSKLESVSKELNRLLIRVLNLLRPLVAKESERYTPLTTLLNTRVRSDDFITSEETRHMNTLHGQERTRERQRLFTLGRQRMMAQEKREAAQRMRLLGLQANWEPVSAFCDGCEMPASTVFPEVAASRELLRGFRGNEEMATVWDTRHFQFPNTTAFSVTGICVTTWFHFPAHTQPQPPGVPATSALLLDRVGEHTRSHVVRWSSSSTRRWNSKRSCCASWPPTTCRGA